MAYEIAARHRQDGASDDVAEVEVKELRKMEVRAPLLRGVCGEYRMVCVCCPPG